MALTHKQLFVVSCGLALQAAVMTENLKNMVPALAAVVPDGCQTAQFLYAAQTELIY